jgi:predicted HicB family RNase H-like nuclease
MEQIQTLPRKEATLKRFGVEVTPDLYRRLKVAAANEGVLIREFLAYAIEKALAARNIS